VPIILPSTYKELGKPFCTVNFQNFVQVNKKQHLQLCRLQVLCRHIIQLFITALTVHLAETELHGIPYVHEKLSNISIRQQILEKS